jgi:hypothetical protein
MPPPAVTVDASAPFASVTFLVARRAAARPEQVAAVAWASASAVAYLALEDARASLLAGASLALAIRTFHKTAFRLYEASYTLSV